MARRIRARFGFPMVDLHSLRSRLSPVEILDLLLGALRGSVPADGIGLAQAAEGATDWQVAGYRQLDQQRPQSSGRFSIEGTAGEWACRYEQPFIGRERRDLAPFPGTFDWMLERNLKSNVIIPLDVGEHGRAAMYLVSRQGQAFGSTDLPLLTRIGQVAEGVLRAHRALVESPPSDEGESLALDDVQRSHIEGVLRRTGGVIEGPTGAARLLGLHPSTLRKKMAKLGVRRRPS